MNSGERTGPLRGNRCGQVVSLPMCVLRGWVSWWGGRGQPEEIPVPARPGFQSAATARPDHPDCIRRSNRENRPIAPRWWAAATGFPFERDRGTVPLSALTAVRGIPPQGAATGCGISADARYDAWYDVARRCRGRSWQIALDRLWGQWDNTSSTHDLACARYSDAPAQ